MGAWSSLHLKIEHQNSSLINGHQGDVPYFAGFIDLSMEKAVFAWS